MALNVISHATVPQLWRARCAEWAQLPALRHKRLGLWRSTTWSEYYERTRAVALALRALGVMPGEVVSVLCENRPEWLYVDMAAQALGGIGNGLYPTSSADQVAYQLNDSRTTILFVENDEQLSKALAVRAQCLSLRKIVVMDLKGLRGLVDRDVMSFDDLVARGLSLVVRDAPHFEAAIDAGVSAQTAFLVYTSGTTGHPKGAMISQANLMYQVSLVPALLPDLRQGDKTLSFLPLCHIAERMSTLVNPLAIGQIVHFPENTATVNNDLREVAPHLVFAPPRFWEKMHSQIELYMRDATPGARWIYGRAFKAGMAGAESRLAGGAGRRRQQGYVQRLALAHVRAYLGLQNVTAALTGAAPVPPDLMKWFMAIGVDLREGYGLTETSGFCTMSPGDRIRLGTAGIPPPGVQIRLGEGGEVLVRGPNVFAGYWGLPLKTVEVIDPEGWLRTGDCGEIDAHGYLSIRDRMKDIIITSGGKNITPNHVENLIKLSPYIADAVLVGEGRHYCTCLLMLDYENVAKYAQDRQIPYTDYASLVGSEGVRQLIATEVETANARLARVEQVKKFRILDQLLTAEDEELTPTMKLKRRVVARKYATLIDQMYAAQ